jgi:hypothetical protein
VKQRSTCFGTVRSKDDGESSAAIRNRKHLYLQRFTCAGRGSPVQAEVHLCRQRLLFLEMVQFLAFEFGDMPSERDV